MTDSTFDTRHSTLDWAALDRLRKTFLSGAAGANDYWRTEREVMSYDATFAQRIGWKWDYVLNELKRRGWSMPAGEALDWGCGSGIAGRAVIDHFGTEQITTLRLFDRSPLALDFAARRAAEKYPTVRIVRSADSPPNGIVLLSHVLTELDSAQTESLLVQAESAIAILWVEPGTYEASRSLVQVRERLRHCFNIVAPCTHQNICGMLAPQNERHWCHHFASPPPEIFTDGNWARFASLVGIDLRDLPLSFLVLDKRPFPPLPAEATRIIGHPRVYKAHALLLGSNASGVHERRLTRRALPDEFRRLKKGEADVLQTWRVEGEEILETESLNHPV